MDRAAAAWIWSCLFLVATGCLLSLVVFPVEAAVAYALVGGVCAALLFLVAGVGHSVRAAPWGGAGFLAFATGTLMAPALTLTLVVCLGLTSPWVVRQVAAQLRITPVQTLPRSGPEPVDPVLPPIAAPSGVDTFATLLRAMSDQALAAAWIESYWTLRDTVTVHERLLVISTRGRYLDEWERRSPAAFGAWLQASPRASGSFRPQGRGAAPREPD